MRAVLLLLLRGCGCLVRIRVYRDLERMFMTDPLIASWSHFLALAIPLGLAIERIAHFRQRGAKAWLMGLPPGLGSLVGAFDLAFSISVGVLEKAVAGLLAVVCGVAAGLYLSDWPRLGGKE
ncbi:hypothetical protein EG19_02755 [Thermoanaerobaculum aquaticum]|uniref:Uncharacterized protein n=1 Tax=Thermoanaerobaculum aquaticum TaxID=1312852 RepID=A0A062XWF1_9BACT|nr:hypothetical protein EG19_02755 [Thermoanaerobaculum aquaticum]